MWVIRLMKVKVLVTQSSPTLSSLMDWGPPGFSVCGILKASILEWVAIPFSRGCSWPRDWTPVSCITGRFFTSWTTHSYTYIFPLFLFWFFPFVVVQSDSLRPYGLQHTGVPCLSLSLKVCPTSCSVVNSPWCYPTISYSATLSHSYW